jgi:sterol desaturase/sphingolipid hydroxylase (fatty acid hydroxylase superfamily)
MLTSELLTIAHGFFAHGNVSLPPRIDRFLRRWIVRPDLHRVHHSTRVDESMSNFGSILALWDRCLGTWRPAPVAGHLNMVIGLQELREPSALKLPRLLWMPFRR